MDPRQSLSRTTSSNVGTPQNNYSQNNMAAGYAMPPYQNQTHLPPINYSQLPPAGQNYVPQQYRNDLPRYSSAPSTAPVQSPAPDNRYNGHMTPQGQMSSLPPSSALPQPHHQQQQPQQPQPPQQQQQQQQPQQQPHQGYQGQQPGRQSYPQPLAPAPPRPNLDPLAPHYGQPDGRQQSWSGAEVMPAMTSDVGRDPTRTHVVGSQGRRGILPSAPGRPSVMANGVNGSPKSNAVPQKDADGKFPCPNCTKTYLHAKHLKRHMLRHTGDRPYMCVLCNDTFSRSDILKRHFQKCSVRRGNPTGASHLSNPAAHLKKNQQAAAKAAANASPASATTPSSAVMQNPPFTTAGMPSATAPATTGPPQSAMGYAMQNNGQADMQRPGQSMQDPNANSSWQMHDPARNSQMMYHSTSTPPNHFGMQPGGGDDKRNVIPGGHHMAGDEWNHMFPQGGNEQYMNPIFGGYDQSQSDVKKEYESHEGGSNGYYIPSTSLGADGTLGPPLWNFHASQQTLFQTKVDALLTFIFPGGMQASLQEHQSNLLVKSLLTVEAIQHFLELAPKYQGHFPWLHLPTFDLFTAYDGLVLVIICSGAVYSDRVSQDQVRALMQHVKYGIERNSQLLKNLGMGLIKAHSPAPGIEIQEVLASLTLQTLLVWHGGPEERSDARSECRRTMYMVRQLNMLTLADPGDCGAFSYLHNLRPGEEADPSRWEWQSWVEQEKRSRLMFMVFLWDASMCIYFNMAPQFTYAEVKLPLPCDDAAWNAPDAESCAQALGLRGPVAQSAVNFNGSLRLKQIELHHAVSALHSTSVLMQARTTNVFSKFILIHALHVEIWQLQQSRLVDGAEGNMRPIEEGYRSINVAFARWKHAWDEDLSAQYSSNGVYHQTIQQNGFCREGVHFYWLACAFLQSNQMGEWQLSAEERLRFTLHGMKLARNWSRTDPAARSQELGNALQLGKGQSSEARELHMNKLYRPLQSLFDSPLPA